MSLKNNRNGIIIGAAGALLCGTVAMAMPGKREGEPLIAGKDYSVGTPKSSSYASSSADEERSIDVKSFTGIRVEGAMELNVAVGGKQSVNLEADEDFVDLVEFSVEEGVLVIDTKDADKLDWDDADIEVTITLPSFTFFELKGAVDAEFEGIDAKTFTLDLRGAGNIELEGTCGTLNVENRGVANVEARDLKCAKADVTLKGVGNLEIYASEEVRARVKGLGSIEISGDPKKRDERVDGLGSIEFR